MRVDQQPTPTVRPTSTFTINPRYQDRLTAEDLGTPQALLRLPGEIVSGHPDRHVVRVHIPSIGICYLKVQHRVRTIERVKQWLAGYGWSSRSTREAMIVRELDAISGIVPSWIAHGEHEGRAFLLVEELHDVMELRDALSDNRLTATDRHALIERFAATIAELHLSGYETPDLSAKHVFIQPATYAITVIDWQNARRASRTEYSGLAALHASLASDLASTRERLQFLRAYRRVARIKHRGGDVARRLARDAERFATRRSIRDQRDTRLGSNQQRLVWVAGEAVCAIPEVAAIWPDPPIAPPFYTNDPVRSDAPIVLADGRRGILVRGHTSAPYSRVRDWLRGRNWRSPGVTIGRVLFHLQRHGIPAPQLLAFGQRLHTYPRAEWFALYEHPDGQPATQPDPHLDDLLTRLHDAGCRPDLRNGMPFWLNERAVFVGDPRLVRMVRRVSQRDRHADHDMLLSMLRSR